MLENAHHVFTMLAPASWETEMIDLDGEQYPRFNYWLTVVWDGSNYAIHALFALCAFWGPYVSNADRPSWRGMMVGFVATYVMDIFQTAFWGNFGPPYIDILEIIIAILIAYLIHKAEPIEADPPPIGFTSNHK